jgi:hypothetical protein
MRLKPETSSEIYSPEIISSGGLGPCIAIGIYHKRKKKGYMLHVACPSASASAETFLDHVIKETKNTETLKVYVCGSSIERRDGRESVEDANQDREFIKELINEKLKTRNTEFNWAPSDATTELFLDVQNGEFSVEVDLNDEIGDESE